MSDREQQAFDEAFRSMVECEESLDRVIAKLALVGVRVPPSLRGLVWDWCAGMGGDERVPIRWRLARLRHVLGES